MRCEICENEVDDGEYYTCENDHTVCIDEIINYSTGKDTLLDILRVYTTKIYNEYYKNETEVSKDGKRIRNIMDFSNNKLKGRVIKLKKKLLKATSGNEVNKISSKICKLTEGFSNLKEIIDELYSGYEHFPSEFCPICNKTHIKDVEVLEFLLKKNEISRENVCEEIRSKIKL